MEILTITMSVIASVVSGAALFLLRRWFKKRDEKEEQRDNAKARENILIIKSINAVGKLTEATAVALKEGKTNGEMKFALKEFNAVDKEMYDYLLERNAQK